MAPLWRQAGAACIVLRQKGNIWRHLGAKLAPRPVRPHPWAVLRGFRRISELGNGPAIAFDGHLPRAEEGAKSPVFDPDSRVERDELRLFFPSISLVSGEISPFLDIIRRNLTGIDSYIWISFPGFLPNLIITRR